MTLYRTIVADPPWDYAGFPSHRGGKFTKGRGGRTELGMPYPSLTVAAIREMPVRELAEADSWLFLWATSKYLPDALTVVDAWGFRYAQTIVWHKTGTPTPFAATVAPNHAEFLLVCRRGKPARKGTWPSSVIASPIKANVTRHSEKPAVFADMVETVAPGPYLELFARRQRLGWDAWGDEVDSHVDLTASPVSQPESVVALGVEDNQPGTTP